MTSEHQGRKGIVAVLVFAGFSIGLISGAFLAAKLLVSKSDGMAGGAIVLFYALLFALIIAASAGLAGKFLPRPRARLLAWISAPVGVAICAAVLWGMNAQRNAAKDALEAGYASLLPFEIQVTGPGGSDIESFSFVSTENLAKAQTKGEACAGPLEGRTRVELLTALRGIEGREIKCSNCDANSLRVYWLIREAKGNINRGEFQVSQRVLAEYRQVETLLGVVKHAAKSAGCD